MDVAPRVVAKIFLARWDWSNTMQDCFELCCKSLARKGALRHRYENKIIHVYTHASDHVWSRMITKKPQQDIRLKLEYQRNEPIDFFSGHFNDTKCDGL